MTCARIHPVPERLRTVALAVFPNAICVATGWALWRLFGGGLIGSDGQWQVSMALSGHFNDWFSPVMTAVLHAGLYQFYALTPIVLIQAVVGCLGVYHLARASIRFLYPSLFAAGWESAAALAILFILLVPLSPLMYYLVYVQNDGWLMLGLVWSAAGWLQLEHSRPGEGPRLDPAMRLERAGWWAAAVLGSAWVEMMRHNAVVLLPVFAVLAATAAIHMGRAAAIAAAAVTIALPFSVGGLVRNQYSVEKVHPEDQILALDLVGVCVERDDLRHHLPYTDAHLIEERFRQCYAPGFVNTFYWYHPPELRPTRLDYVGVIENGVQQYGSRHAELVTDYRQAMKNATFTLAAVKVRAFLAYVLNDHANEPGMESWHPTGLIVENPGQKPRPGPAPFRAALREADAAVARSPGLRFLCTNHLPWLIFTGLAVTVVGYVARQETRAAESGRRWRIGFLVLLLPVVYYASHLAAVAGPWYRYMYPATLLVQIGGLAALTGALVLGLRRLRVIALGPAHPPPDVN